MLIQIWTITAAWLSFHSANSEGDALKKDWCDQVRQENINFDVMFDTPGFLVILNERAARFL